MGDSQKAPPLAGELSVNDSEQTEEEYLTALGFFEPFPFRLLITFAATFPASGDSFCSAAPYRAFFLHTLPSNKI